MQRNSALVVFVIGVLLFGCSTIDSRITGRTATEQYLVTAAVDRALSSVRWGVLKGHRVFIQVVGVQATEYEYIHSALEKELIKHGAKPVETLDQATVKIVAMVHAVGTDIWLSNFGIPIVLSSTPSIPTNLNGVSLYNSNRQDGYCRINFYGIDPVSQKVVWKTGPIYGDSYFKTQTFLGFFGPYKSGDIFPERKFMLRPKGYKEIREREIESENWNELESDS